MELKPLRCPGCGGHLRIAQGSRSAKCEYCRGEVLISVEAEQASLKCSDAVPVQKTVEWKLFDYDRAKRHNLIIVSVLVGLGVLSAIAIQGEFGLGVAITFIAIGGIAYLVRSAGLRTIQEADEEMVGLGPKTWIEEYRGACPYCETSNIRVRAATLGANCMACGNRIVLRDSKFYAVSAPRP